MKIKLKKMSYESAMAAPIKRFKKIRKSNIIFTTLVKILSFFDLKKTNFKLEKINMDRINKKETCLYLMNHCSFIDLKIAMSILYPKPINIVTTSDGKLNFKLDSKTSYSICCDFYWYEIGDIVCIGDNKQLFFLFPKTKKDVVAKLRLAAEEIYKYKNNI